MTHTISKPLAHLRTFPQFIVCHFVPSATRPGKTDKIPVDPVTGRNCSAMDPGNWMTADAAEAAAQRLGQAYGIGFVITPSTRLFCVDIDGALQADNTWSPLALALCARFPDAAVEVSQSGTGLHIWGTYEGDEPLHTMKNAALGLELYSADRFIALGGAATGDASSSHLPALQALIAELFPPAAPRIAPAPTGAPAMSDEEVLRLWLSSAPVTSLPDGFPSPSEFYAADETALARKYPDDKGGQGRPSDRSNVDDAAARGLAYFTRDADQIERILRGSALLRDKWDDHKSYLARTIQFAIESQEAAYVPRIGRSTDAAAVFAGTVGTAPAGMVTEAPASRQAAAVELSFLTESGGALSATIDKVSAALTGRDSRARVSYDCFTDLTSIEYFGQPRRPLRNADYGRLRALFERCGSKPVPAEIMKTAVGMAADDNQHDSAIAWAETLAWDGVARIDTAMVRYYGCEDTPYARSVGAWLFTALAGRCTTPGIKSDMALTLIGLQGGRKSTSVETLCPISGAFGEINLKSSDDALAKQIRGKLLLEVPELNGYAARDQEALKAWLSRSVDEYRPLYENHYVKYQRRCVVIGTGNVPRFLDDETGARRWLPIHVGTVDIDALRADRDQLWAEGLVRFKAHGIAWQDAERLAREEHSKFQVLDERQALVETWLQGTDLGVPVPRCERPVRPIDVAIGALNYLPSQFTGAAQKQVAKIMKNLGYAATKQRVDGRPQNLWVRTGT